MPHAASDPGRPTGPSIRRLALVFLAAPLLGVLAAEPPATWEYVSDLRQELNLTATLGWGTLGIDTGVVPPDGRPATPLKILETTYAKGLGHHAAGDIVLRLEGAFVRFQAQVGILPQGGNRGSVVFRVLSDGQKRFESQVLNDSSAAVAVDVPVEGVQELRLASGDAGDGIGCDCAIWADAKLLRNPAVPATGRAGLRLRGQAAPPPSAVVGGLSVVGADSGPQVAVLEPLRAVSVVAGPGEDVVFDQPLCSRRPGTVTVSVLLVEGGAAEAAITVGEQADRKALRTGTPVHLEVPAPTESAAGGVRLETRALQGECRVRWSAPRLVTDAGTFEVPLRLAPAPATSGAPPPFPALRPGMERELVEWDWRLQDGIGTPRRPATYAEAVELLLRRGDRLLARLQVAGVSLGDRAAAWAALHQRLAELTKAGEPADSAVWEPLWLQAHTLRRELALADPLAKTGPVAFVKQVPSIFSHQLTQYYGNGARPGGGVFVLERPGETMRVRRLADGQLPEGSYQHLDVSWDGRRLLFAYCHAETVPANRDGTGPFYHLCEIGADGTGLRHLTDGPSDDFAPRYLPDDRIVFCSTRRGGFHRCGRGPCPVYTLALAEADGANPRTISFHETHEWDPAVLNDGRLAYTRWDYVDRSAVYYQQLWSVRQDGTDVRILFGNNTFNPVGIWESRAVPGSRRIMATAAAHHAMTAGSIILLDPAAGVDGLKPITRLTPDALFPESECTVAPTGWNGNMGVPQPPPVPAEQERWPGHCYRSPYPLAETVFLAAYSYDRLIGEPGAGPPNMFGLYLVDADGNKELLYRDLNLGSQWPMPLRPRAMPPNLPSVVDRESPAEGTFILHNVYASWPAVPPGTVRRLRIVQVLPKTTPHANAPMVGAANASPGKQVLGTVPVAADGSACFRAPARIPLLFQALDERGQAVQSMRSLTYLQPGETASCVGCHESRLTAPASTHRVQALACPPSTLAAAPDGACPLSYPLLVQPVLDRNCVRCHSGAEPKGQVTLTGAPEGAFSRSYNELVKRVPFSSWSGGDFRESNGEPLTVPGRFGACASPLMRKLWAGHKDVKLSAEDAERLVTWMDANALFYGTFNPDAQARQLRGERIPGPDIQ